MAGVDNDDDKSNAGPPEPPVQKPAKPVPFFATIHHRHYAPGEIEKINEQLLARHKQELKDAEGDNDPDE